MTTRHSEQSRALQELARCALSLVVNAGSAVEYCRSLHFISPQYGYARKATAARKRFDHHSRTQEVHSSAVCVFPSTVQIRNDRQRIVDARFCVTLVPEDLERARCP